MRNLRRWVGPFVLAAAVAVPASAGDTVVRTFPFQPGDLLEVEIEGGSIDYATGGSGEITIQVVADRGKVSDYLELEFDPGPEGLRVEGDKVGGGGFWSGLFGHGDVPLEFRIVGPASVNLTLATAGGDISLADVAGEVRLATSGGDIEFGEIEGRLKAATSGGDIHGTYVSEESSVATSGGDIRVEEAGGDLKVATSGGNIEVEDVRGKLEAGTSGGNIRLGDIQGDVSAKTSGGNIRIGAAGGGLRLATSGGDIHVAGSAGEARIATSGGDVFLGSARGYVSAATSGGDLEVTLESGEGAELETSGGTLTVHLPAGAGFDVDADARGGRVRSDLPIVGSVGRDRVEGTIGGGGKLLRLRNRDGDIRIQGR